MKIERSIDTDVLIIGSGVAGLTAAYQLLRGSGKRVTVLSTGLGASPYITGFDAPVCQGDSPEQFFKDVMEGGSFQSDETLARILTGESPDNIPFLEGIGFPFDRDERGALDVRRPIGAAYPRVIGNGFRSGAIIIRIILDALRASERMTVLDSVRALRLLTDGGRIAGALCYDTAAGQFVCFRAPEVLLACGGFCRLFAFSTNTSDIGGDGVAMAYHAGAALTDMEFVHFEPTVALWPEGARELGIITTLMYEGALLRNGPGERFMTRYSDKAECVNKDVLANCIYREIQEGRAGPHGGVLFDATAVGEKRLRQTYNYDRVLRAGLDMSREPVEVAPAALTSLGGVEIDSCCRTAVSGLYACGEVTGHIHGANRLGGAAGTEVLVFGRRAGSQLSKTAPPPADGALADGLAQRALDQLSAGSLTLDGPAMDGMRRTLGQTLSDSFNLSRNGADMQSALARMEDMGERCAAAAVRDGALLCRKIRLINDLTAARLMALSALERTDSVGCHTRTDHPEPPQRRYRTRITHSPSGPTVCRTAL